MYRHDDDPSEGGRGSKRSLTALLAHLARPEHGETSTRAQLTETLARPTDN
eukprot:COSAG01_NODE_4606_length_4884_cov_3.073981_6_plen_51_part_00